VRTKTAARRQAILAAAKAVFEEVGFEQATMSEITARVGGSKATIYRYFDSKEALFLELLNLSAEEHGSQMTSLLEPTPPPPPGQIPPDVMPLVALLQPAADVATTLKRLGISAIRTFYSPQKMATWRMVIAASARNPAIGREFYENGPAQGTKHLERYFEAVIQSGKLRSVAPHVACAHFIGLLKSEVDEPALLNVLPELTDSELTQIVERAVDAFMFAYAPRS
jgi:AcrR family transcriptional regulator